ncbi:MAG: hypothetical protein M1838_003435 [Thelocarpon superellum]|nr:MAG: hypothetical protein M1838_003435 [Thelocarpon superellum]
MIGLSQASSLEFSQILPRQSSGVEAFQCNATEVSILKSFRTLVNTKLKLAQTLSGANISDPDGLSQPDTDPYGEDQPPQDLGPGDNVWQNYFTQSDGQFVQNVYQQMLQLQPDERCSSAQNAHCDGGSVWDAYTESFCPTFFQNVSATNASQAVLDDAANCANPFADDNLQTELRSLAMMSWLASAIDISALVSNASNAPYPVQRSGYLLVGSGKTGGCTSHTCVTGISQAAGNDQTSINSQYFYGTYVLYAQDIYNHSSYCSSQLTALAATGAPVPANASTSAAGATTGDNGGQQAGGQQAGGQQAGGGPSGPN